MQNYLFLPHPALSAVDHVFQGFQHALLLIELIILAHHLLLLLQLLFEQFLFDFALFLFLNDLGIEDLVFLGYALLMRQQLGYLFVAV